MSAASVALPMAVRLAGRPNREPTERRRRMLGTLRRRLPLLGGKRNKDLVWQFSDGSSGRFQGERFIALD